VTPSAVDSLALASGKAVWLDQESLRAPHLTHTRTSGSRWGPSTLRRHSQKHLVRLWRIHRLAPLPTYRPHEAIAPLEDTRCDPNSRCRCNPWSHRLIGWRSLQGKPQGGFHTPSPVSRSRSFPQYPKVGGSNPPPATNLKSITCRPWPGRCLKSKTARGVAGAFGRASWGPRQGAREGPPDFTRSRNSRASRSE